MLDFVHDCAGQKLKDREGGMVEADMLGGKREEIGLWTRVLM